MPLLSRKTPEREGGKMLFLRGFLGQCRDSCVQLLFKCENRIRCRQSILLRMVADFHCGIAA